MITTINVVHILLNEDNDPTGEAGQYIAKQMGQGVLQTEIVRKAWAERFMPTAASASAAAPAPFRAVELYYDPSAAPDGAEQEVIDVIIDASKR